MNIRREKRTERGSSNLPYKTLYDPSTTSKDKRWTNFLKLTKRDAQSQTPKKNQNKSDMAIFENGSVPRKTKTWDNKDEFFAQYYHGTSHKTFQSLKDVEFEKSNKDRSKKEHSKTLLGEEQAKKALGITSKSVKKGNNIVNVNRVINAALIIKNRYLKKSSQPKVFKDLAFTSQKSCQSVQEVQIMVKTLGIDFSHNEAKALVSLADSTNTGNLYLKDFINFQRFDNDPLPEIATNTHLGTEYAGGQAVDKKLTEKHNVPMLEIDEFVSANYKSLTEHLKTNRDNIAMLALKGMKSQVKRILKEKKYFSIADFREMTDKLGLRSTMDLNWETLKDQYFNNENKILEKEKFMSKLLELEEKEKLHSVGTNKKDIGRDKTHHEVVKKEDLTEETISKLENFKYSVMNAEASYLTTNAHLERAVKSKEKVFGNFSNNESVLSQFHTYIADDKNLLRESGQNSNIENTKVINRKEQRGFITDFVKKNHRLHAKPQDFDCILSVLNFNQSNNIHIDDVVKYIKEETVLSHLEERKQLRKRALPYMAKSESMCLSAEEYGKVDFSKAFNSKVEESGLQSITSPAHIGNTEEDLLKTFHLSGKGDFLTTSEAIYSASKKDGKLDRNQLNDNYRQTFDAKNFDMKKAMTKEHFHEQMEKGNMDRRGNYNTTTSNPYAPKQIEIDSNPQPNGESGLTVNKNCSIWAKKKDQSLQDCFTLTSNPTRMNFEKYSQDMPIYMDTPNTDRIDLTKAERNTLNAAKSTADLIPKRMNNNKLKYLMTKLDDALFPTSDSHKTVFDQFDKNMDGYICEKDFVEKLISLDIFNKQDSKSIFNAMDSGRKGYLSYAEFHEMIKPGCAQNNFRLLPTDNAAYNKSVPYNSVFPTVKECNTAKSNSYNVKDYRKMVRDNFNQTHNITNTRFGYIPPSYAKDTFKNFTASRNSGMFMNNADRFMKDINRHTIFQKEEKAKNQERISYKTSCIQNNSKWLDSRKCFDDIKKDMKGKAFSSKEMPTFIGQ